MFMMRPAFLPKFVISLTFGAMPVARTQLITLWDIIPESQTTTQILSASVAYSPLNVIDGITDYQAIEVDSLRVVVGPSGTQTLLSTPITYTYTLQQGASFFGLTFLTTTALSPGETAVVAGDQGCQLSPGVLPSESAEVLCIQVVSESGLGEDTVAVTTVGLNGRLHPLATITASSAISTIGIPSSTAISSTPPSSSSPSKTAPPDSGVPFSQVTVFPTSTSNSDMKLPFSWGIVAVIALCSYGALVLCI
ncbi:hypothetical protein CVT26_001327 [Gymnopilus dilepis]|uniref:Uncharacterized protein n=1 Tax=Gymnopilus dilepis TaxID=231916 RepID=A0A409YM88_9AGAR|nr:hypothetical protein CVT26_001327 [Gymnopilus dilepis]